MADLHIQICYAEPDFHLLRDLTVAEGTTLQQAIMQSGVLREVTAIDLTACKVGIYGKLKTPDTVLREHDRIEIYRPLIADPKDSRRLRAESKARKKN
ncbi:MAG: rnfH [Herbaspirillum sp.]|jgi:putative ubiquitin-RnfH superfamily antitoxin RatB of RatAB toxin-antitoxin module|nr:rnfH [Herbaspirillum sp.]